MHLADTVAYIYLADMYCPPCIDEIALEEIHRLGGEGDILTPTETLLDRWAKLDGIDRQDEVDSDDLPQAVLHASLDGDEHCGRCHRDLDSA